MQPLRDGPQRVPIAVDAMGGDHAPDEIVPARFWPPGTASRCS